MSEERPANPVEVLKQLQSVCQKGGSERPAAMNLSGLDLSGTDLSHLDLSGYDFSGADLSGADLSGSNLSFCQFGECNLAKSRLDECEFLGAYLKKANLNECSAERAGFGTADLSGAAMIHANLKQASLSKARLNQADLRAALLVGARLSESDLQGADLSRADLRGANLEMSNVGKAKFDAADLRDARLHGITNYLKAHWVGADIRGVDLRGAYMVRRAISDENYLYEFRTKSRYHRVLYWLWWATSDCGRSLLRWTLWIALLVLLFAVIYTRVDIDFGGNPTAFSPIYYSIVTLTTLGYGDVIPASGAAQVLATIEALLGYVGLGGLLSILSNKMARRAD